MRTYGLLGEKLSHSFSPLIHSFLGDYEYRLFEKTPEEVGDFLKRHDFDGLNVTIPYKKTVVPFCAEISANARKIGSVNTILRLPDGRLSGDNTDYYGFYYLISQLNADIKGKKVLVLGGGGSSLTVRTVLNDLHAGSIVTVSRTGDVNYNNLNLHHDAQLIVNTTPVGMYPDIGVSPIELSAFPSCEAVVDIIYNPYRTKLLLDAENLAIGCVNGLPMLVAQAKSAAELFTGSKIDDDKIGVITDKIYRLTKNIVLIGMPGSGKSTIGAALAKITGRDFFDTDVIITDKSGKSISEIINGPGESVFRQMETEALRDVSKKSGCVIATGGGIVKTPENRRLIRQNSICIFLDRDLDALPADGRPLSLKNGIGALASERLPLYNNWCDYKVGVDGVEKTAQIIKELLGL